MNQLLTVITECLVSGAIFSSLCAAVVVPPLAWFGVRALAPAIRAMTDDRHWQAALATCAAILPGSLFLALVVLGIVSGASSPCLQLLAGKVLYGLLALLIVGAIVRSLIRAYRRERQLYRLLGTSTRVTGRAAEIAAEVGVPLFEVDDGETLIVAAATPYPGVYISTGALSHFDDAELRAALFHERAHLDRGDHRIAPWLYFITELLPLPVDSLVDTYRCSREFCADRCAVAHVKRADLASALLLVARSSSISFVTSAAFAERDAICGRLAVLLQTEPEQQPDVRRRTFVVAALCALTAVGLGIPLIATFVLHCNVLRLVA